MTAITVAIQILPTLDEGAWQDVRTLSMKRGIEALLMGDHGATHSDFWGSEVPARGDTGNSDRTSQCDQRNEAIDRATGRWIMFCTSDDVLGIEFDRALEAVRALESREEDGPRPVRLLSNGVFERIDSVSDLFALPEFDNTVLLFDVAVLRECQIRFDLGVGPDLRGTVFLWEYLTCREVTRIEPLSFGSVTMASEFRSNGKVVNWGDPANYGSSVENGYHRLLSRVSDAKVTHVWLERCVLASLVAYFEADFRLNPPTGTLDPDAQVAFIESTRRVLRLLPRNLLDTYALRSYSPTIRAVFKNLAGTLATPAHVRVGVTDRQQGVRQILFFSSDPRDLVEFRSTSGAVTPIFGKYRSIRAFGEPVCFEGLFWVPISGELSIRCHDRTTHRILGTKIESYLDSFGATPNENILAVRRVVPHPRTGVLPAHAGSEQPSGSRSSMRWADGVMARARARSSALAVRCRAFARRCWEALPALVSTAWQRAVVLDVNRVRRRYAGAWLLMDRPNAAGDSAEHLYRHLSTAHPEINAWYVLKNGCADWNRLEREGFKLVAYGTREHSRALAGCRELVCSHIHQEIVSPVAAKPLRRRLWRFTFLQHGVIKEDLSRWLNDKSPATFLTSTPQEYASIAGNLTPYKFSRREVALTGLPRHDALLRKARAVSEAERNLVLFMPTWRKGLIGLDSRPGEPNSFWDSDFARHWIALLTSVPLHRAVVEAGLQMALVPHPDLQRFLDAIDVPAHLSVLSYAENDVQELLARASHVVTDFSSVAFDAAILERPILYYHFDAATIWAGGHIGRPGYFSYADHGFGPITSNAEDAVAQLIAMIGRGKRPGQAYRERIDATFTMRDGGASERVVQAVLAKRTPAREWTMDQEPGPASNPPI